MTSDQALEELYAASPESFTERRDAIVKELKAAGDKDGAAALAKRRKPTQVAFVLNQLARKHPDDVAAFVDVGRALARAHRKALRGVGGGDLAEAIARQRTAVATLTARVAALLDALAIAPEGVLDKVAGALQAALVDPVAAAALEEGLLEKAPEAASSFGFDEVDDVTEAASAPADVTKAGDAQRAAPGRRAPTARRRTAAEDAKAKRDDVKRARDEAKRARDEARRQEREAAAEARRRAREQERVRLEQARAELAALVEAAEAAEDAAARAVAEAKAARAAVDRAKSIMRKRA